MRRAVAASVAITLRTTPRVLAEPTAACLAQGASCKNQGEADTDSGSIAAVGMDKKRQEQ
jgi:hypothetical protein